MKETDAKDLTEFQDTLLSVLADNSDPDDVLDILKWDGRFAPYRDYVEAFDKDMIAVAIELTRRWGRRCARSLDE